MSRHAVSDTTHSLRHQLINFPIDCSGLAGLKYPNVDEEFDADLDDDIEKELMSPPAAPARPGLVPESPKTDGVAVGSEQPESPAK